MDNQKVKLQIWDTAGQERYRAITSAYYWGAKGGFLFYDITKHTSFEHLETWHKEISEHTNSLVLGLIGNKSDLEHLRAVSHEEGKNFAEKQKLLHFWEISLLNASNLNEIFHKLASG